MALPIHYAAIWGKQDVAFIAFRLDTVGGRVYGALIVRSSKNGMSLCNTLSTLDASIRLRQCCRASKLVYIILIPEAAGGLRLRHDATSLWLIIMASLVHYTDNAGRNDKLKWSTNEVLLMSFIACEQDPGSYTVELSPLFIPKSSK
jgi:hypothetical protein